jgi:hypothetical protein
LAAEPHDAPQRRVAAGDRGGAITDRGHGGADGLVEQLGGVARRRWLVAAAGRVEADDRVAVDDAAVLVFGDPDDPDPDLAA